MKPYTYYLELAARIHVFLLLNIYGLGKIAGGQFHRNGNLPAEVAEQTLGNVNSFDLAWTFMGHSYAYILFIGISQVIGAWCLLWNRTKLLGIAILIPILETYGALASAIIYFSLLMMVLFLNKAQVLEVINTMTRASKTIKTSLTTKVKSLAIAGGIVACIFGFEQILVNLIGH